MHRFEPTYKRIGDHTEAILIEFNEELTYEDILEKFWKEHTPGIAMRQYRSAVFYHDEAQREAAERALKKERAAVMGRPCARITHGGIGFRSSP